MGYENMNTGSRRPKGGTRAACGAVPRSGEAAQRDAETVSAPTFFAAAVLLAIDAFLSGRPAEFEKREGEGEQEQDFLMEGGAA